MADRGMRDLERRYSVGDVSVLPALNAARRRMGLSIIRTKVVHYIKADYHHRIGKNGKIDARVDNRTYVYAACGSTQVWPRVGYGTKEIHFTPDKAMVTCKTCLRCLKSPRFSEGRPALHWALKSETGLRNICGGLHGPSTDDPDSVGCGGCLRLITGKPRTLKGHSLNARGRRRLRRQTMFAFKS